MKKMEEGGIVMAISLFSSDLSENGYKYRENLSLLLALCSLLQATP